MKRKTYSSDKKYTENTIIDGFRIGNKFILKWAYENFQAEVTGAIVNRGGNQEDAKNVIHETVIAIHWNIQSGKYNTQNKFEHYFMKVALNIWSSHKRKRERRGERELKDETLNIPDDNNFEDVAYQIRMQNEQLKKLQLAISKLKDMCQKLIRGYHLEKKKFAELAKELQIKEGTARVNTLRCRKQLKELMLQM